MYLDHLGLTTWPFSVVPRQQHCDFLAGRPQLRDDISTLLQGLSRRDTSSIHVLWSWFGAGKTHSLYYLVNQTNILAPNSEVTLYPVYSEFPKRARSFFDLYQAAMLAFDTQLLTDSFMEVTTSPNWSARLQKISDANPDLLAALRAILMGKPHDHSTAVRWLRGDPLAIGEFRKLGISQRLTTTDQAVRVFSALVEICDIAARSKGRGGFRLIWVLDEFQRLEKSGAGVVRDVNAGLHSLFNSCPTGLSIIISFSGRPDPKRLPEWMSPELRDRIGATKVMVLPPFQPNEAHRFIKEVLAHFRAPNRDNANPYFPFTADACDFVIKHLAKQTDLRPRVIMHAMNAILEAAEPSIEQGKLKQVDSDFARRVLDEYVIVSDPESEDVD